MPQAKGKLSPCFIGHEDIAGAWWSRHVRNPARRRSIDLNVTMEQAWDLFLAQDRKCKLTGLPLKISLIKEDNTASLDRIDSLKGYEIGNLQWVHKTINKMKNNIDQQLFCEMCYFVTMNYLMRNN